MIHRFVDLHTGVLVPYSRVYFDPTDQKEVWYLPGPTQVTSHPAGGIQDIDAIESPDGTRVVFSRIYEDPDPAEGLYVCDIDGANEVQIESAKNAQAADWHPDGALIIYRRAASIYTVEPDGTNQTLLYFAAGTSGSVFGPQFNSDGSKIAFVADKAQDELWVMDADGTNDTKIDTAPSGSGSGDMGAPHWSPVADVIAYNRGESGVDYAYRIDADGTNKTQLSTGSFSMARRPWTTDGSLLIGARTVSGGFKVHTMDAVTGGETIVTPDLVVSADGISGPLVYGDRIYLQDDATLNLKSASLDGSGVVTEDGDSFTTFYIHLYSDNR